jgi:peptidoglycan/LPS O-acetylase OafA/YrhL
MSSLSYRPEIDGLRAIAVLSVIFFHFGVDWISGGFVGVDIFFVISGFLITKLIKTEYEKGGSFSFSSFYARRARRLLPAYFAMLIASFLIGFLCFSPAHFERFSGALFYSLFSLSNFYFWQESGYFDLDSVYKPLLHTWSVVVN